MTAPLRPFASPYARKLARERGIALVDLAGSGPSGRIVAADVLGFARPVSVGDEPPPSPIPEVPEVLSQIAPSAVKAALAVSIDFGALRQLADQFETARMALPIDAVLLRAASRGLAGLGMADMIGWEKEGGALVITGPGGQSLTALQGKIEGAGEPLTQIGMAFPLSIRRFSQPGVRPVSLPLRPGCNMRLVVSGDSFGLAECLLCFDAERISEEGAILFLAQLKNDLEAPLRLLA